MTRDSSSDTDPLKVNSSLRAKQCVEMRARGEKYRDIAEQLGISAGHALRLVQKSLQELKDLRLLDHEWWLNREVFTTEQLLEVYLPVALDGDIGASEHVLKILNRRANYLGLNAPAKMEGKFSLQDDRPAMTREEMMAQITARLAERQQHLTHEGNGNGKGNGKTNGKSHG